MANETALIVISIVVFTIGFIFFVGMITAFVRKARRRKRLYQGASSMGHILTKYHYKTYHYDSDHGTRINDHYVIALNYERRSHIKLAPN